MYRGQQLNNKYYVRGKVQIKTPDLISWDTKKIEGSLGRSSEFRINAIDFMSTTIKNVIAYFCNGLHRFGPRGIDLFAMIVMNLRA